MKNCFVWLDFACVDENKNPDELIQFDVIIKIADYMFTPIFDPDWQKWELNFYSDMYEDYNAKNWKDERFGYLNRGWCRIEMFYAANIPLLESNAERKVKFAGLLLHHLNKNRRPHVLYGSYEGENGVQPHVLDPLQNSYFEKYHPLKGFVSVEKDKTTIESLVNELKPYMVFAEEEYFGDRNSLGEMHGYGIYKFGNGDVYEGEFKNNEMSGHGIFRYLNGGIYTGSYKNNEMNGQGTFEYDNGDVYEGGFKDEKHSGHGICKYLNGDVFEGDYENSKMNGHGTYKRANGVVYVAEYENGKINGHATYKRANGDVYESEFKKGEIYGPGIYKYANGDVYIGRCDIMYK
jgi:hypothetical protein